MGLSFRDRAVCHLDLVQEATDPVWSSLEKINPQEADAVLRRDLTFLSRQLEDFPFRAVVCTSARVLEEVSTTARVQIKFTGKMARLTWYVGKIHLNRGSVGLAAWNIPLKRATGLKAKDEPELGGVLRRHLELLGTKLN